jgi:UDP-glucose 4-epimerase
MKVLVTGGAGFIGSHVAKVLNADVIDNLKTGCLDNIPRGVKFIHADCSDESILNKITDHYDVIIHIAGQASKERCFDDVFYDLNANLKSTLVLLELCKKYIVKGLFLLVQYVFMVVIMILINI